MVNKMNGIKRKRAPQSTSTNHYSYNAPFSSSSSTPLTPNSTTTATTTTTTIRKKNRILPQCRQPTIRVGGATKPTTKTTKKRTTKDKTKKITKSKKMQCWAHSKVGIRCSNIVSSREGEPIPVPYCGVHLKSGDGAVRVIKHPLTGYCLVARFDLPAKYRLAYWGVRGKCPTSDKEDRSISFYPPDKITGRNKEKDGTRTNPNKYNGVMNPGGTGDLIQYAACPGPNERQNMRSTGQYWGLRNGNIGGLEFITLESIPKDTQLCHWYGSGWWSARGVKRMDVGTQRHPAPKRTDDKIN